MKITNKKSIQQKDMKEAEFKNGYVLPIYILPNYYQFRFKEDNHDLYARIPKNEEKLNDILQSMDYMDKKGQLNYLKSLIKPKRYVKSDDGNYTFSYGEDGGKLFIFGSYMGGSFKRIFYAGYINTESEAIELRDKTKSEYDSRKRFRSELKTGMCTLPHAYVEGEKQPADAKVKCVPQVHCPNCHAQVSRCYSVDKESYFVGCTNCQEYSYDYDPTVEKILFETGMIEDEYGYDHLVYPEVKKENITIESITYSKEKSL